MFSTKQTISGPVVLQQLEFAQKKYVYIVGEVHNVNGNCEKAHVHAHVPSTHVIEHIAKYASEHPSEKIMIVYEGSDTTYKMERSYKPPTAVICDMLVSQSYPKNIRIAFGDCRRMYPYDLFMSLFDFNNYAIVKYYPYYESCILQGTDPLDISDFIDIMKTNTKRFEKEALQHLTSRAKVKSFLMALILPDRMFPAWYLKYYHTGQTPLSQNSGLKVLLQRIKEAHPEYYKDILLHLQHKLHLMLDTNMLYSPVMDLVADRRKSRSSNIELMKDKPTEFFFVILYSFMLDIYVIAHNFVSALDSRWDHYVIVAGATHAQNISRFFTPKAVSSWHTVDISGKACVTTHGDEFVSNRPIFVKEYETPDFIGLFNGILEK